MTNNLITIPTFNQYSHFPIVSSEKDTANLYDTSTQKYFFKTAAQKDIFVQLSGSIDCNTLGGLSSIKFGIFSIPKNHIYNNIFSDVEPYLIVSSSDYVQGSGPNAPIDITGSNFTWAGEDIQILGFTDGTLGGDVSFNSSTSFFITSSAATATSSVESIPEPYLTQNFNGSDCDILQGSIEGERPNPFLQDLDYQTSQTVPVNIQAVVSDSATKATVPESNYTQLTSTNIKYDGSKNQSKQINQWTKETVLTDFSQSFNIGTYGKTSPIEAGGSYVLFFYNNYTDNLSNGKFLNYVTPDYLINSSGDLIEIGNDSDNRALLNQAFTTTSTLPSSQGWFGQIDDPTQYIGQLFKPGLYDKGLFIGNVIDWTLFAAENYIVFPSTGSYLPYTTLSNTGSGIIYPADILYTPSKDLPSQAFQILLDNNIITQDTP